MKSTFKLFLISAAASLAGVVITERIRSAFEWRRVQSAAGPGTALITGASAGIGAAFARELAREGYDLVLVARRENRLRALAEEIALQHPVSVEVFPADLDNPQDVERLERRINESADLSLLVNNAGFGTGRSFAEADVEPELRMVNVHVVAPMRLMHAALPGMIARGYGAVINVSSLNAFVPAPGNATYGATKSFLNAFSEAVQGEVWGTGVRVQALCPGFTVTELHDAVQFDRTRIPSFLWMQPEPVVAASLRGLRANQTVVIPGLLNKLMFGLITFLPFEIARPVASVARRFMP